MVDEFGRWLPANLFIWRCDVCGAGSRKAFGSTRCNKNMRFHLRKNPSHESGLVIVPLDDNKKSGVGLHSMSVVGVELDGVF